MCSPELRKKSQKKTFEHDISPLCRGAPAGPIVLYFCMLGGTHDLITRTKFQVGRIGGYEAMGVQSRGFAIHF